MSNILDNVNDRLEEMLENFNNEKLHVLDRVEAGLEMVEISLDYNEEINVRHYLRKVQRLVWDETDGR